VCDREVTDDGVRGHAAGHLRLANLVERIKLLRIL